MSQYLTVIFVISFALFPCVRFRLDFLSVVFYFLLLLFSYFCSLSLFFLTHISFLYSFSIVIFPLLLFNLVFCFSFSLPPYEFSFFKFHRFSYPLSCLISYQFVILSLFISHALSLSFPLSLSVTLIDSSI